MHFFIGTLRKRRQRSIFSAKTISLLTIFAFAGLAACSPRTPAQNPLPDEIPAGTAQSLPVTGANASCSSPAKATVALTEGPYFKAGSPERASLLEATTKGTKLVLSGYVFTPDCSPAAHALLDFWQANAEGQYDNSGYILRGHQYTDATGYYELTTIVPGLYPGRTEHIHVKVQAPGGPVLTTQLFFPGVAENASDGIFDASLVLNVQPAADGLKAEFNFVVPAH